jgi:hypothetical protein
VAQPFCWGTWVFRRVTAERIALITMNAGRMNALKKMM